MLAEGNSNNHNLLFLPGDIRLLCVIRNQQGGYLHLELETGGRNGVQVKIHNLDESGDPADV